MGFGTIQAYKLPHSAFSLSFNGTNSYVNSPAPVLMPFSRCAFGTGNFSICQWVYVAASGDLHTQNGLVSHYRGATPSWYTELLLSSPGIWHYNFGDPTGDVDSGVAVTFGNWNHFVITREGTGTNQNKMYVNGSMVHQWTNTSNYTSTTNRLEFGNISFEDFTTTYAFKGLLDDVAIFNRALTATEVTKIYTKAIDISTVDTTSNRIGLWKFEEGFGTNVRDSFGNNDGTLVNGPIFSTNTPY